MLTIITGQPGNGKTLYTLWLVERLRKESGRPVYYVRIDELKLPWELLNDPFRWYDLPPASIVVIDEAQKTFRPRPQGSAVPKHVSELETHRHGGVDLYLLTQHPHLIDTAVRKLAGRHLHVVRRFGASKASIYQWEDCQGEPANPSVKSKAIRSSWSFPQDLYGVYKSAELHTVKKDFPVKYMLAAVGCVAVIVASVFYVQYHFSHGAGIEGADVSVKEASGNQGNNVKSPSRGSDSPPPPSNPWDVSLRAPRLSAFPESSPYFDELVKSPTSIPRVSGCYSFQVGPITVCKCHSWQGNVLPISIHECKILMRDGWFDPQRPYVDYREENIAYLNATRSGGSASVAGTASGSGSPSMGSVGGSGATPSVIPES